MSPITREYYRVPRNDRESFICPAPAELAAVVERNRALIGGWTFALAGRPVAEFRAAARAEILDHARHYGRLWGFEVEGEWSEPQPIILTGHQPPPFHPGVWVKNFLAGALARAVGGAAVNLNVDNDEAHGPVVRFPERSAGGEEVSVAEVPLAAPPPGIACEEQTLSPKAGEASSPLARGIAEVLRRVHPKPLQDAFERFVGHLVVGRSKLALADASSMGEVMVVARRRLEEEVGLRNYELPVSRLADTPVFRLFAAEILRRREDFFAAYNDSLAEYRRAYRERSAAQPVPDLARDGPRLEMPLWVWRAGEARRHLWVELRADGELAVYANSELVGLVHASDLSSTPAMAARLGAWRRAGWKVRPRALTLTLFARLAVGEVFIHGLGGALYDKVTDGLFERLWGVRPPEVVLASCTVRLPLETFAATPQDLFAARRAVRDWRYNTERRLPAPALARAEVRTLADEKRRLVSGMAALERPDRRPAYLRIHQINELLAAAAPDGLTQAAARLGQVERQLAYNAILEGREYPFFFYDADELARYYSSVM
jgi:hypothetical protein